MFDWQEYQPRYACPMCARLYWYGWRCYEIASPYPVPGPDLPHYRPRYLAN